MPLLHVRTSDFTILDLGVSENRDPNMVPKIVGSILQGAPTSVPLLFGNSHLGFEYSAFGIQRSRGKKSGGFRDSIRAPERAPFRGFRALGSGYALNRVDGITETHHLGIHMKILRCCYK